LNQGSIQITLAMWKTDCMSHFCLNLPLLQASDNEYYRHYSWPAIMVLYSKVGTRYKVSIILVKKTKANGA